MKIIMIPTVYTKVLIFLVIIAVLRMMRLDQIVTTNLPLLLFNKQVNRTRTRAHTRTFKDGI